jgi:hypothetical protein
VKLVLDVRSDVELIEDVDGRRLVVEAAVDTLGA